MVKLAEWQGSVWQVRGLDGSDEVEVMVKSQGQVAFFNVKFDDLPAYGEQITVTFSRGAAE